MGTVVAIQRDNRRTISTPFDGEGHPNYTRPLPRCPVRQSLHPKHKGTRDTDKGSKPLGFRVSCEAAAFGSVNAASPFNGRPSHRGGA